MTDSEYDDIRIADLLIAIERAAALAAEDDEDDEDEA